jgi:hypothetical protein
MPNFTDALPPKDQRPSLALVRVKPGKPIQAIVTATNFVGCETHYWHGRTAPCEQPNCEACDDGSPTRFHAYIASWNPATNRSFLLEITRAAADAFDGYRNTYGSLRGCRYSVHRASSNPNSRVIVELHPADEQRFAIPQPPNVIACLCTIWHCSPPEAIAPRLNGNGSTNARRREVLDAIKLANTKGA